MKRRTFLKSSAVLAAAAGAPELVKAAGRLPEAREEISGKLIASAPVLQNFADTSIGVTFTVNALANGYVLVGEKPDLSDARKILCGGYRLADIDERVIMVRVTGLKPATRYYYRIGADRIHYGHGYDMKILGNEEDPEQPMERKDYAARTPYLFCPGNHDSRGRANRHLERVWMYRQPEERDVRDWDLGRNFAVRLGDMALIGLDTAEDKVDTNPIFAGLFKSKEYREAQTVWLRDALVRPEIASAPFLVAFCHIPLFDDDPTHNPGDVYPNDTDPRYSADFAYWQRTCAQMWGPLLHAAGCQVLITAHMHAYKYFAPAPDRCWAQLIGGGPRLEEIKYPTVIEGKVAGGKLRITVHNILSGQIQDEFSFARRF